MKINSKKAIKNFKGIELKNGDKIFTIGDAISEILGSSKEHGKMKLFLLAEKFAKNDIFDIDKADFELVKTMIEKTDIYPAMISGQVLVYLGSIKEK